MFLNCIIYLMGKDYVSAVQEDYKVISRRVFARLHDSNHTLYIDIERWLIKPKHYGTPSIQPEPIIKHTHTHLHPNVETLFSSEFYTLL
mmetsp:Transcript_9568/g.14274  ORF Transcript_9568/g.14274 Transcript_9568/m.14274 type:complete len:89 (-) Transcript_9568:1525-1791(-)